MSFQDRDIKATVFRICGSVPASNFIFLPKTSSQSLNLTGGFFFLIFKPLPSKYFVVHLELVTTAGMVIRVSFSNLFKEFKSTSTWLQFPFKNTMVGGSGDGGGGVTNGETGPTQKSSRWTFLALNLKEILSKYLFSNFAYLKNIKLCANVLVKGVFTSDQEYCPLQGTSQYLRPLPREMNMPLPKGTDFFDIYDYVCFPCEDKKLAILSERGRQQLKGSKVADVILVSSPQGEGTRYAGQVPMMEVGLPKRRPGESGGGGGDGETRVTYSVVRDAECRTAGHVTGSAELADHMIDEKGMASVRDLGGTGEELGEEPGRSAEGSEEGRESSVHLYARPGTEVTIHRGSDPKLDRTVRVRRPKPTVSVCARSVA